MYVICIMYFISATINFMKFKLNLILNKKENDQQMQNGKKKKKGGDFGNARSSSFKTSIYNFFHHSY